MTAKGRNQPVTMKDVAARAGVSRALVSIVVRGVPGASPTSREKVLRAAAELDYHPDQRARLLSAARSRTLGVVYGLHQPFHGELVEAVYAALARGLQVGPGGPSGSAGGPDTRGWRLAAEPSAPSRSETDAVRALLDQRCEALLLLGPNLPTAELAELANRIPVVVLARAVKGVSLDVVRTDDAAGARLAVEHLVGLGHRRIAHLHGGRAPGAAERRAGYRTAMGSAALTPHLLAGGLSEADGEAAAPQLLQPDGPTAVLAFNDACAAGLLAAVRAGGASVPERLSVMGYDDSAVAALSSVSLTTVGQDAPALASQALHRAVERADDASLPPAEVVLPPRIVVRHTTAVVHTR